MARHFVALGSNLGDRAGHLLNAVRGCTAHGLRLTGFSEIYETDPVGGPPGQGPYLNAVVSFDSGLDALVVLQILRAVEDEEGRVRSVPGAPRTLDLDLLLSGNDVRRERELTLPHPRLRERLFVLRPLADLEPDLTVPGLDRTVSSLLEELLAKGADAKSVRPYP